MDLERVTWITVHLLVLNFMSHSNDHFANLSRSSWSISACLIRPDKLRCHQQITSPLI